MLCQFGRIPPFKSKRTLRLPTARRFIASMLSTRTEFSKPPNTVEGGVTPHVNRKGAERAAQMAALRPMLTYKEIGWQYGIAGPSVRQYLRVHGFRHMKACLICGIKFFPDTRTTRMCSAQCRHERHRQNNRIKIKNYYVKHPGARQKRNRLMREKTGDVIRGLREAGCINGIPARTWIEQRRIYQSARQLGLI